MFLLQICFALEAKRSLHLSILSLREERVTGKMENLFCKTARVSASAARLF